MSDIVVAMFHDRDQAFAAVDALVRDGIDPACIGFLATRPERFGQLRSPGVVEPTSQPTSIRSGKGPVAPEDGTPSGPGRTSAGLGAALRDITRIDVPDVGPALVAGPLASSLPASPSWPDSHAIVDMLVRRGFDTAQARVVREELHNGGILITVHDGARARADQILERYGPMRVTAQT